RAETGGRGLSETRVTLPGALLKALGMTPIAFAKYVVSEEERTAGDDNAAQSWRAFDAASQKGCASRSCTCGKNRSCDGSCRLHDRSGRAHEGATRAHAREASQCHARSLRHSPYRYSGSASSHRVRS